MDDGGQLERAQARVGTTLKGKWRVDALIGMGGMAAVYKATHRNGNEVAIKMLHPEISLHATIRDRFLREGYVGNKVKQEGAVTVTDDDVADDGAAFLVMEFLDGESLETRRERKGGRLPVDEVLSIVDRLLDVLVAAHAQGIVHRDLKPDNLFLTRNGTVKVLDFGIARLQELTGSSSATQTGSMMGTPAFMAPEQARGRWTEVDGRTDLWAVGATIFTLLTGQYVHEAETATEAIALAIMQPARSIGAVDPTLPPPVIAFVDRSLAFARNDRWSSAEEMQTALRDAYGSLQNPDAWQATRPSIPDAGASSTITASPELISQITGRAPEATTAQGVAASTVVSATAAKSRVPIYAAAGAVVLGVLVVAVVVVQRGTRASSEPSVATVTVAATQGPVAVTPAKQADPTSAPIDAGTANDTHAPPAGGVAAKTSRTGPKAGATAPAVPTTATPAAAATPPAATKAATPPSGEDPNLLLKRH